MVKNEVRTSSLEATSPNQGFQPVEAQSLTDRVYRQLRQKLMRGHLVPHQRIRVREMAAALGTSETPVREAIFQLVRDRAFELKPRHYIRVRRLDSDEYLELREIRLRLEPLAALRALPHLDENAIDALEVTHRRLIEAERAERYDEARLANFDFHFGIYWRSGMPALVDILESLWIQVGPLLNLQYPHGRPTYDGRHQHEHVLDALRRADKTALCTAIEADLIEGGRNFLRHLRALEGKGE